MQIHAGRPPAELTGSLTAREMQAQVLDSMDYRTGARHYHQGPRRGMMYTAHDGELYQLNLIDTPGHVDFSYESLDHWLRAKEHY